MVTPLQNLQKAGFSNELPAYQTAVLLQFPDTFGRGRVKSVRGRDGKRYPDRWLRPAEDLALSEAVATLRAAGLSVYQIAHRLNVSVGRVKARLAGPTARASLTKERFLRMVTEAAEARGWSVYRNRSPRGFPDLLLVYPRRPVVYLTLVGSGQTPSALQEEWLYILYETAGTLVAWATPEHWPTILALLHWDGAVVAALAPRHEARERTESGE